MSKPSFETMTKKELRAYVLANTNDTDAFHALCDLIYAEPGITITSPEQLEQVINARRASRQQSQE